MAPTPPARYFHLASMLLYTKYLSPVGTVASGLFGYEFTSFWLMRVVRVAITKSEDRAKNPPRPPTPSVILMSSA